MIPTIEGNKLIAEFMGVKEIDGMRLIENAPHIRATCYFTPDQLEYHTSWDWLMPVVEKIAKLGFRVKTNFNPIDNSVIIQEVGNSDNTLSMMYYSSPIEVVWLAVIQFITWYNQQNPLITASVFRRGEL